MSYNFTLSSQTSKVKNRNTVKTNVNATKMSVNAEALGTTLNKRKRLAGGPADVLGVRAGEINVIQSEGNAKTEADDGGRDED